MSGKCIFVLDTNVLIDALMFPNSFGRRAFDIIQKQGSIVYSRETFAELAEVVYRQKFDRFITDNEREVFLRFMASEFILHTVKQSLHVCRDPKDDKFLDLAVATNARFIITRDDDLLTLSPFQKIYIIEPKTFLEKFADDHRK